MRIARSRGVHLGALAVVASVALSACGGGGSIDEATEANESQAAESGGDCGELNMAVNPWVGYQASAYVVGVVAQDELGCTVNYKDLKEDVSWQGFGTGEVDVVIEDWGHPDLEKKFVEEKGGDGSATDFGEKYGRISRRAQVCSGGSDVIGGAATSPPSWITNSSASSDGSGGGVTSTSREEKCSVSWATSWTSL